MIEEYRARRQARLDAKDAERKAVIDKFKQRRKLRLDENPVEIQQRIDDNDWNLDGGQGSGFFGHKGRVGEVGGSVKEGGSSREKKEIKEMSKTQYAQEVFQRLANQPNEDDKYEYGEGPRGKQIRAVIARLPDGTSIDIDGWRLEKRGGLWRDTSITAEDCGEDYIKEHPDDWDVISEKDVAFGYLDPKTSKIIEASGEQPKDIEPDEKLEREMMLKEKVLGESEDEKIQFLRSADILEGENLERAKYSGEIDNIIIDYFDGKALSGGYKPQKDVMGQPDCPMELRGKELVKYREDYLRSVLPNESEEEVKKINDSLYAYTTSGKKTTKEDVETIDRFIDKAPAYDGTIYRGLSFRYGYEYYDFVDSCKIGAIIENINPKSGENALSSWSSKGEVASRFANVYSPEINSVTLVCKRNKTSVPIQNMSDYGYGEAEVLAKSTARWVVVGKRESEFMGKKDCTIYVEEVDDRYGR